MPGKIMNQNKPDSHALTVWARMGFVPTSAAGKLFVMCSTTLFFLCEAPEPAWCLRFQNNLLADTASIHLPLLRNFGQVSVYSEVYALTHHTDPSPVWHGLWAQQQKTASFPNWVFLSGPLGSNANCSPRLKPTNPSDDVQSHSMAAPKDTMIKWHKRK